MDEARAITFPSDGGESSVRHGGGLIEARRRFPDAREPFIDLSTGINPVAYPVPDIPKSAYTRLPEPEEIESLQAAAARAYGAIARDLVAAAPGTQLLIGLMPLLFPMDSVAILSPTYGEHAVVWSRAGARVHPVEEVASVGEEQGVVLCNPNNPDGRVTPLDDLAALAGDLAANGGVLVVDEAFADFADDSVSAVPLLPHPGLIVLRSFGKSYGLAGLRLGFALSDGATVARIRAALGPWPVSGPAVHIACTALADEDWRARTRARLAADAARLDGLLIRAGFEIAGGTLLFRLAQGAHATEAFERLGRAGILVRPFDEYPNRLRFGLPADGSAWARLEAALPAYIAKGSSR